MADDGKAFKAIGAMALNRVIGSGGRIPWHFREDFRWFKRVTWGNVVVMGRKTYESLGRPLPGRLNVVITRGPTLPGVLTVRDPDVLEPRAFADDLFVIGGAEVYRLLLPRCAELFLTVVKREVDGDTFFPEFEADFALAGVLLEQPEFEVRHYRRPPR